MTIQRSWIRGGMAIMLAVVAISGMGIGAYLLASGMSAPWMRTDWDYPPGPYDPWTL